MTAHRTHGTTRGTHAPARSPRPAAAGRAAHVARTFARALRRAVGPATVRVPHDKMAAAARVPGTGAAPVFHPPGVIRVVTPAELDAAGAAGGEATSR